MDVHPGPLSAWGMSRLNAELQQTYRSRFDRVIDGQVDEPLTELDRVRIQDQLLRGLASSDAAPAARTTPWLIDAWLGTVVGAVALRAHVDSAYALRLTRSHFEHNWKSMKHFRLRDLTRDPI